MPTEAFEDWSYDWNRLGQWGRNFDVMWGVAHVLRALGVSDKAEEDGGRIGCEYVSHGDPTAQDDEGPIPISEQLYKEPGGMRWLHVRVRFIGFSID
jgi:hypothetical protein